MFDMGLLIYPWIDAYSRPNTTLHKPIHKPNPRVRSDSARGTTLIYNSRPAGHLAGHIEWSHIVNEIKYNHHSNLRKILTLSTDPNDISRWQYHNLK